MKPFPILFVTMLALASWGCTDPAKSLKQAHDALDVKDYAAALKKAREGKSALLKQDHPDQNLLGKARYLEFVSLYDGGKKKEARTVLLKKEPKPYKMLPKDEAWMNSVGAEMAADAGDVDVMRMYIAQCVKLRQAARDQ